MNDLILRASIKNIGVELQDTDDDCEPLYAVVSDTLLTKTELLALADAILDRYGSTSTTDEVRLELQKMRDAAPTPRCYPCPCGVAVEVVWPNNRIDCTACGAVYTECDGRILRTGDLIIEQVRR
jgi:hypothetical protein